jgi:hypothetical protein
VTIYNPSSDFVKSDSLLAAESPFPVHDPAHRLLCVWDSAMRELSDLLMRARCSIEYEISPKGQSRLLVEALSSATPLPLVDVDRLYGVGGGVYAIYYTGPFPFYESITLANKDGKFRQPIYVGKANRGSRKGNAQKYPIQKSIALQERLRIHQRSIVDAVNLDLADFFYRAIIGDSTRINDAEVVLIEHYQPMWNCHIDGFSNKFRKARSVSNWDALHPGRQKTPKLLITSDEAGQEPPTQRECDS